MKKIIISAVIFFNVYYVVRAEADSLLFNVDVTSTVKEGLYSYKCEVSPLAEGVYMISLPLFLRNIGDFTNFEISDGGATYTLTTNFLEIGNLWQEPGQNFYFSFRVPVLEYVPSPGIMTSYGYIPGWYIPTGDWDMDNVLVPKFTGGVIPEPATALLLLLGMGTMTFKNIKKKRR